AGTHNRYALTVNGRSDLDVASFSADEALSRPYRYQITFTSRGDIAPAEMLLQDATFSFNAPGTSAAARSVHGVVTGFSRLS
ncbi:contractile injection system protein, VgrG/Pvc8 family, partial [Brenneria populi subsp. brevivirga]|uniref:contractile injection system protein, VgrG/Pvc8 family n=1 Tax=Brenneria populi TaxID=1505588 RepID=UPI002E17DE72|nr:contractile injection system protein, VgrG/Pvc8 family [Brenneria populi subsp. brevivirga]